MEKSDVIAALAALAQETRLDIYRYLVAAGPGGAAAGSIGTALGIPAPTLSFHLKELRNAGLVTQRRVGRSLEYSACFASMIDLIGYLTRNCCAAPQAARPPHGDCA